MGTIEKVTTPKTGKTRYLARYSYTEASGKRAHRKRRFDRKKDAEAWIAQNEADLSRGVYFEPSREPFGNAVDRWLASLLSPPLASSTLASYRKCATHRLLELRTVPMAELTEAMIQHAVNRWQQQKLSSSTIHNGMKVVRGTIRMVMAERGLMVSPLVEIKLPKMDPPPMTTWTPAKVEQFLRDRRDDPWVFAWQLLFATGMRIGELCALRWDDVDWDAGEVQIRRTWTTDEQNKPALGDQTKTMESRREIPLPPHILAALEFERDRRSADDGGWICANGDMAATTRLVRYYFVTAVNESKIKPAITPHDARHTAATNMIAAGVPVAIVSKVLGHRDPGFTMRRYVHPAQDEMRAAMNTLGALYRGETTLASAQTAPKVVPISKNVRSSGE